LASHPAQIRGLFEAHLAVVDLDRSIAFYRNVLGLPLAYHLPERNAAFFWTPTSDRGMLGLWSIGSMPMAMTSHVAFSVSLEDVLRAPESLRSHGITPLDFERKETDDAVVLAWMPAASIYFRDLDGHLLEYLCMLDDAPQPERGVVPYKDWLASRARLHARESFRG
jgi:lactoylglutathione lyase